MKKARGIIGTLVDAVFRDRADPAPTVRKKPERAFGAPPGPMIMPGMERRTMDDVLRGDDD